MRLLPLVGAILYGLMVYVLVVDGNAPLDAILIALSFSFLFGLPFGMGFLAARGLQSEHASVSLAAAWVPVIVVLGFLFATGSEGLICIVMALPLVLGGAAVGGLFAHLRARRATRATRFEVGSALVLPLIMGPFERAIDPVDRFDETVTSIEIAADAARVWDEIAEVDTIRADERGRALYTMIGFPPPLAATLDLPQEGGIRRASFAGNVLFTETITEWEPGQRLAFEIDPSFDEGAPALDPHVRIGGEHFDVLSGTYTIEPRDSAHVRLVLSSRHRVRTRFNVYAGWWSDLVMRSVQREILAVIKARAEDPARPADARIRSATRARAMRQSADERVSSSFATGFSVVADLPGRTDVYADSVVVLVRDGRIAWPRLDPGAVHDSTTASLAQESGTSWIAGRESRGFVVERGPGGDTLSLGPMVRFTIPRDGAEALDSRWVVFTHHLTVPKTPDNPYGKAWTYTHAARAPRVPNAP